MNGIYRKSKNKDGYPLICSAGGSAVGESEKREELGRGDREEHEDVVVVDQEKHEK